MLIKDLKPVKRCPHCYHLIPAWSKECPYCESDEQLLPAKPAPAKPDPAKPDPVKPDPVKPVKAPCVCKKINFKSKTFLWILIGLALVAVGVVVGLLVSKDKTTDSDKDSVAKEEVEVVEEAPAEAVAEESVAAAADFGEEYDGTYDESTDGANDYLGTYTGTLNNRIKITMCLVDNYDGNVNGYYYYGDGDNGILTLTGYYDSDNDALYLDESSNDNVTGHWYLSLVGSTLVGTMTNWKDAEYSVYLER